jgi:hypothetical protein
VSVENSKPLPEYELDPVIGQHLRERAFVVANEFLDDPETVAQLRGEIERAMGYAVKLVRTRAPQEAAAEKKCKCCGPCHGGVGFTQGCAACAAESVRRGLDDMKHGRFAPTSREAAAAEGEDLRQFGYAPGDYLCLCKICHSQYPGDKRSWNCEKCAAWLDAIRSQAATKALAAVKTEIEADREKLRANGMGYKSDGAGYTRSIMLIDEARRALSPQTQNKE